MKTILLSASVTVAAAVSGWLWSARAVPTACAASPAATPAVKPAVTPAVTPAVAAEAARWLGRLPAAFVPNLGQWAHAARYVAKVGAMTVFLQERGWSFTLVDRKVKGKEESRELLRPATDDAARGVAVRMTFAGTQEPELVAEQVLPGKHNYFLGNDPTTWRSDVPLHGAVRYRGMHDGVDVRVREHDGHFEYDLLLAAGAQLASVEVVVEGIEGMHVAAGGDLVMDTVLGPVRMPVPVSWEEGASGERAPIPCHYELRGRNRFGFVAPERTPGWAMVVDPGLVWSTFLGGADYDDAYAVALDALGRPTVAGVTRSAGFPVTPGAFDPTINSVNTPDTFVTRMAADGATLVFSTFVGGGSQDYPSAVAVDLQGAVVVAGSTLSTTFPTTPLAFDTTHNGAWDGYVFKLAPTGASLAFSTYLGGSGQDGAYAVAIDASAGIAVAGQAGLTGFPVTAGAFDTTQNGNHDAFVVRLSASGSSLLYGTFLGGSGIEWATAVVMDTQGVVTVAGQTESTSFPVTPGAYSVTHQGGIDAFLCRLDSTGAALLSGTLLGGSGDDGVEGLTASPLGGYVISGGSNSPDFPTTPGAFDTTPNGGFDLFVAQLSGTLAALGWSTVIGTPSPESMSDHRVDSRGAVILTGQSDSSQFPTTAGAFGPVPAGGSVIVTRLAPGGSALEYSARIGPGLGIALAVDRGDSVVVVGSTGGAGFPVSSGVFDPTYNGGLSDAFVARLDLLPTGVGVFGTSTSGCAGPLPASVTAMPQVGSATFAITCGNAPSSAFGAIALSGSRLLAPIQVLGGDVWLDPAVLVASATVASSSGGACEVPLPIPNQAALVGMRFYAQFFWSGPNAPSPCPAQGLSASFGLDVTIQP